MFRTISLCSAPFILAIASSLSCAPSGGLREGLVGERTEFVLGTACRIAVPEGAPDAAYTLAFGRLREIETLMSANAAGTEIDRINAAAGIAPVSVSAETYLVIARALHFAALSDGAFDPTVGPLVKAWKIGFDGSRPPSPSAIEAARSLIDYRAVTLDPAASTVFLPRQGMALDLGAIAKGHAADEAARVLADFGARGGIIDLGGNILAFGSKPDGKPWRVGVQNPFDERGAYLGIVTTSGASVVSSGVYERFFEFEGRRYHHLLDVATGYPVSNRLWQVTIVGPSSLDCDALSTAVFCLGPEKGMRLADELGVAAIFVFEDRSLLMNNSAKNSFEPIDASFAIVEHP
jgi:thiamine biosynthesis lipoprotein